MVAMIADSSGVRIAAGPDEVGKQASEDRFFWLDIVGEDVATRSHFLSALGVEGADAAWVLRFGQAGRMHIGRQRLRAVTWLAEPSGALVEVHVVCWGRCIVTVWSGDAAALDDIRQQFAERVCGFAKNLYHAGAILLQLLLGTLDHAIRSMDTALDALRTRVDKDAGSASYALLARRSQKLQSVVASFDRYSSSVRSAIVGIETVVGVDALAASELDDYAEQVVDVEEQFYERRRWMSEMMHDYATAIAQRQGEQINRLTLVSLIFLPVTALTGFFGMNFDWMNKALDSAAAFFILGVFLPVLLVLATVGWLIQRGLIQFKLPPLAEIKPATEVDDRGFWASGRLEGQSIGLDPAAISVKTAR
jgi:Mg2+ and Co2+ transporter CorA